MLGKFGGHLGRKWDNEPGVTVLWRGWTSLYGMVDTLRPYKHSLRRGNSS